MLRRGLIAGTILCLFVVTIQAQQRAPADQQSGLTWTEDQVKEVGHHVRAGRALTPISWPNGARVAVCLSFDPDNFSTQMRRGDSNNIVGISLGEYAPMTGIPRLVKLLDKHDVPASWYIPAVAAMLHPEMIQAIKKRPRDEVAIHGWIHENPMTLDDPEEEWRLITQSLDLPVRRPNVPYRSLRCGDSRIRLFWLSRAAHATDSNMTWLDLAIGLGMSQLPCQGAKLVEFRE